MARSAGGPGVFETSKRGKWIANGRAHGRFRPNEAIRMQTRSFWKMAVQKFLNILR